MGTASMTDIIKSLTFGHKPSDRYHADYNAVQKKNRKDENKHENHRTKKKMDQRFITKKKKNENENIVDERYATN